MRDVDWMAPSLALTLGSGALAFLLIPNYSGIMPALLVLPFWLIAAAVIASVYGFFAMMHAGVKSPIYQIRSFIVHDWRTVVLLLSCVFVAGLNMITFMWIKPLLNYLVPFWADPLLADLDNKLFFGHDPWSLFTWLNSNSMAIFYHRGWFAMMILTLLVAATAPRSPERSAFMLSYFLLWSVIGPLVHTLLPAAGPVFFEQMGYGDRFSGLQGTAATEEVAAYLWTVYSGEGFGPGSGISAMPSMHIATTAWMVIGFYVFARRWIVPMAAAALLIFLLSISLGWHYAMDGIVGAASAFLCYCLLRSIYRRRAYAPMRGNSSPGRHTPAVAVKSSR